MRLRIRIDECFSSSMSSRRKKKYAQMHIPYVCEYFVNKALTASSNIDSSAAVFVLREGDEGLFSTFNPLFELATKRSGEEGSMP